MTQPADNTGQLKRAPQAWDHLTHRFFVDLPRQLQYARQSQARLAVLLRSKRRG